MRVRLPRLRRRLSYANVMATFAVFLGLAGGASAGVKYIANGDPAGGDLTGSYPNPTIAAGKVGTTKLGDGAVTASKLAALPARTELTTENGWNPAGGAPSFYIDLQGICHLEGQISGGASGSIAFTLPVQCRPSAAPPESFPIVAGNGDDAELIVYSDGSTVPVNRGDTDVSVHTSLVGVSFRTN